jgi:hypothetical protein
MPGFNTHGETERERNVWQSSGVIIQWTMATARSTQQSDVGRNMKDDERHASGGGGVRTISAPKALHILIILNL